MLLIFTPIRLIAGVSSEAPFPVTLFRSQNQVTQIPDWTKITLRSLPPIQQDGSFSAPAQVDQAIGYNLSRSWTVGQTADRYLKLGDLQTSFYPQVFNLYSIAKLTGLDINQTALAALEAIQWQTISDLVAAIPGLSNHRIDQIAPLKFLLSKQSDIESNATLGEILQTHPQIGQLRLGSLDKQLEKFAIASIPGLENILLQRLKNWENSTIAGVPGLANVPLSQMPNPIRTTGAIGQVDVVYGMKEQNRNNTISGSQEAGFQVTCQANCPHLELTGDKLLQGKQWISGKYQTVKGGFGILAAANGGKEPTGRHPFGEAFKIAVWDTDERSGTASTTLFFRICKRGLPDLGCTPYFLGPVPFLNYREKQPIFTGILDANGGGTNPAAIPENVLQTAKTFGIPASALPGRIGEPFKNTANNSTLCGKDLGGVDFETLADAFSGIEGDYGSVGSFVCDGDGNCGRGLGRYQYMSYRSDVRSQISQHDGGAAFLAKADAGESLSQAEVDRVFPPEQQDQIFRADQTLNIQQARQEGFSGGRLIERVGQIHFGGAGAPIDGDASDVHGRLTLKSYGEELRQSYEGMTKNSTKTCTPVSR